MHWKMLGTEGFFVVYSLINSYSVYTLHMVDITLCSQGTLMYGLIIVFRCRLPRTASIAGLLTVLLLYSNKDKIQLLNHHHSLYIGCTQLIYFLLYVHVSVDCSTSHCMAPCMFNADAPACLTCALVLAESCKFRFKH